MNSSIGRVDSRSPDPYCTQTISLASVGEMLSRDANVSRTQIEAFGMKIRHACEGRFQYSRQGYRCSERQPCWVREEQIILGRLAQRTPLRAITLASIGTNIPAMRPLSSGLSAPQIRCVGRGSKSTMRTPEVEFIDCRDTV
jgi:hypothetical protein